MCEQLYQQSITDRDGFLAEAAEAIHWYKKWDKVLDDANPPFYRWFAGGLVNSCYNALDWHVANGRVQHPHPKFPFPQAEQIC